MKIYNHECKQFNIVYKIGDNTIKDMHDKSVYLCENIIPNLKTKRDIITINLSYIGANNSIVFVTGGKDFSYLSKYKDIIIVTDVEDENLLAYGKVIILDIFNNKEASKLLQAELDKIDGELLPKKVKEETVEVEPISIDIED